MTTKKRWIYPVVVICLVLFSPVLAFAVNNVPGDSAVLSTPSNVRTDNATNIQTNSATLNGSILQSNYYLIRKFQYKELDGQYWADAGKVLPASPVLVDNLAAIFDGLLITKITGTLHTSVNRIELYKGTVKLSEYAGDKLLSPFEINFIGAGVNDALTVKAHTTAGVVVDYTVNVIGATTRYDEGPYQYDLTGLKQGATYQFKTMALSTEGWDEGETKTFTTKYNVDMNSDGSINILDLLWMAQRIGPVHSEESNKADVNQDNQVNILDLLIVEQNLGK